MVSETSRMSKHPVAGCLYQLLELAICLTGYESKEGDLLILVCRKRRYMEFLNTRNGVNLKIKKANVYEIMQRLT